MNTTSTNKSWILLEFTAGVLVLIGVALRFSGSMRVGSLFIAMGIPLVVGAALKLKHLKLW